MIHVFETFLTSYDPSDLPGGSVDPLGFDRAYTFLADRILPGLTNVASHPRYFSVLCAGVLIAGEDIDPLWQPRKMAEVRRTSVLRFERLWGLANILAAQRTGRDAPGIRGITYVQAEASRLARVGSSTATSKFKVLSRQQPYGVLGIYGAVAEGLRFLERQSYTLTPDGGERLGQAFIRETNMPSKLRSAILNESEIGLTLLTAWGERAFIGEKTGPEESKMLYEALHRDPLRSRMAMLLAKRRWRSESELERLQAIAGICKARGKNGDIRTAIVAIIAFERCYQTVLLCFERLLWLCREHPSGLVTDRERRRDPVLGMVHRDLPTVSKAFIVAIDRMKLQGRPEGISDVVKLLESATSERNPVAMSDALLTHHKDVQHGKFDRGRPKMPWIEAGQRGISLTLSRVGGRQIEVKKPSDITPHQYRLASADALIAASRKP